MILSYGQTMLQKQKADRPRRRQGNMDSWELLQVLKWRILCLQTSRSFVSGWMSSMAGTGFCLYEMLLRFWSQIPHHTPTERRKKPLCEIFTNSFVSCKAQHCAMEFRKSRLRGMEVAMDRFRGKTCRSNSDFTGDQRDLRTFYC